MKLSTTRRSLILANIFNSLVAVYFIIIAIVGLVQLRWYHQLTITVRVRHVITLTTSYFAFFILILVALVLLGLFVASALRLTSGNSATATTQRLTREPADQQTHGQDSRRNDLQADAEQHDETGAPAAGATQAGPAHIRLELAPARAARAIVFRNSSISDETNASICCSIALHLIATIGLIGILLIWLFNTGELVRDSISTQLDYAFARYQFTNRSNHYSIAIDGMQDINNCCGSLDFTDFPHQRVSGLSSGHYPGSCCGKNIFGVNARVLCTADEIYRARQTVSWSWSPPQSCFERHQAGRPAAHLFGSGERADEPARDKPIKAGSLGQIGQKVLLPTKCANTSPRPGPSRLTPLNPASPRLTPSHPPHNSNSNRPASVWLHNHFGQLLRPNLAADSSSRAHLFVCEHHHHRPDHNLEAGKHWPRSPPPPSRIHTLGRQ